MSQESQGNYCRLDTADSISMDSSSTPLIDCSTSNTVPYITETSIDSSHDCDTDCDTQINDAEELLLQSDTQETEEGVHSVQATMVTGSGSAQPSKSLTRSRRYPQSSLVISGNGGVTHKGLVTLSGNRQAEPTIGEAVMESGHDLEASSNLLHLLHHDKSLHLVPQDSLSNPHDIDLPPVVNSHIQTLRWKKAMKQNHETELKVYQCLFDEVVKEEVADGLSTIQFS